MLLVLALDRPSRRTSEAFLATVADVTFLAISNAFTRPLAGVLWGLFQAPVILTVITAVSRMRLSLAANRDLQAKSSAISRVNPVAILVSDPSAKDELITRCRFSSILHNYVLLFLFRITQTTSTTSPGGIQEDRKICFFAGGKVYLRKKNNSAKGLDNLEFVYGAGSHSRLFHARPTHNGIISCYF